MPQDWTNLVGGFAQGLVGGKNAAQDRALNEQYKNVLMDQIKSHAKLQQAQLEQLAIEGNLLKAAIGGQPLTGGMSQGTPQPQPNVGPMSQTNPPSVPEMAASMKYAGLNNPLSPTGGQAPPVQGGGGMVQIAPEGQLSYRNNNPFNVRPSSTGWEQQFGGVPGEGNFIKFPTPEAGAAAAAFLIKRDYADMPLDKALLRYAPPEENKNIYERIAGTAKALGVSPQTKVGDIPLNQFMTVMGKYESPHQINPAFWGDSGNLPISQTGNITPTSQAASQTQTPQLNQFSQQRGQLTPQKFLEGYLKKKWGVEPDQATVSSYGDHKLVTDKKSGQPLFIIAGQGKTEMVDVTMPDGSVIKRPVIVPPSPLPGGIPVINMAGQATPGTTLGGPMQVGPPKYTYEETSAPGGGKQKIVVPQAHPGVPPIETKSPGLNISDVGKTTQIMQAGDRLSEINKMVFPNGKLDRTLLFKAAAPMGGIGEGSILYSKMYQTIDAALRLETGAQATPGEIQVKMNEFWPSAKDTEATIKSKMSDLNQYIERLGKLNDPTGQLRQMGGGGATPVLKVPNASKPSTASDYLKGIGR